MRTLLFITLLAGCAAPTPPTLPSRPERDDPFPLLRDSAAPIVTTVPIPDGWTAQRALDALAERGVSAQVAHDGLRLEELPPSWAAAAGAYLADRARLSTERVEVGGVRQTVPVEALPRLRGERWQPAPGLMALVVAGDDWRDFCDAWLKGFVRRRWSFGYARTLGDAPTTVRFWYQDDEAELRAVRLADDVAVLHLTLRTYDATPDEEPVVWHEGQDAPSYALSRTTYSEARVTRRLADDERLVLLQRVSADEATITALGWSRVAR